MERPASAQYRLHKKLAKKRSARSKRSANLEIDEEGNDVFDMINQVQSMLKSNPEMINKVSSCLNSLMGNKDMMDKLTQEIQSSVNGNNNQEEVSVNDIQRLFQSHTLETSCDKSKDEALSK